MENGFFDGLCSDEAVHGDCSGLSDPVGSIGGLAFHSRVPPRVEMDDVVGVGQVDAGSASAQGNQKYGNFVILETTDDCLSVFDWRFARQGHMVNVNSIELTSDYFEK